MMNVSLLSKQRLKASIYMGHSEWADDFNHLLLPLEKGNKASSKAKMDLVASKETASVALSMIMILLQNGGLPREHNCHVPFHCNMVNPQWADDFNHLLLALEKGKRAGAKAKMDLELLKAQQVLQPA